MCAECMTARSVRLDKACSMAELTMFPTSTNASECVSLFPESKSPFNAAACAVERCTRPMRFLDPAKTSRLSCSSLSVSS